MSRYNAATTAVFTAAAQNAVEMIAYNPKFISQADYTTVVNAINADATMVPTAGNAGQQSLFLLRIGLALADTGTSASTSYTGVAIQDGNNGAYIPFSTVITHIKATSTVRRFARSLSDMVYDYAKLRKLNFAVGVSHGVPSALGHIGFDFADGITASKLSAEEALALDAAKRVGLFKSSATAVTSNAALYHKGLPPPSEAPGGLILD